MTEMPTQPTGICTGVNGEVLSGLILNGTNHTNAGSYSISGLLRMFTGNYFKPSQWNALSQISRKADARTCVVTPYLVEYDRLAHTASGICTGVMGDNLVGLDLTGTTHTAINSTPMTHGFSLTQTVITTVAAFFVSDAITVRVI